MVVCSVLVWGCEAWERPTTDYATAYPLNTQQARSIDVQVVRDDAVLTISNTTAAVLPAGRLWVNQAFSRPVDELPIGETVSFDLYEFRNRFDEPFRAGGFFATQNPLNIYMVQWQTEQEILGLLTVEGDAELR